MLIDASNRISLSAADFYFCLALAKNIDLSA